MKRMTKLLSLVLAALMLVGMLPLGVWAAGETHTVRFNLNYNGAPKLSDQKVADGEYATQPEGVIREGWHFAYWYVKLGDNKVETFDLAATPITKDVTLYARWTEDTLSRAEKMAQGLELAKRMEEKEPEEPEEPIQIFIDNDNFDDVEKRIVTKDSSIRINGRTKSTSKIKSIEIKYDTYYHDSISCNVVGTSNWYTELALEIGTNTVTVTVEDIEGNSKAFTFVVNRINETITYNDNVKAADKEDFQDLAEGIVTCYVDDNGTLDSSDDTIVMLVYDTCLLLKQIRDELLQPGEVYMIPQNEYFLTGFTGIYEYNQAPRGTEDFPLDLYPDDTYQEIIFSYAGFADLFDGDISIDLSSGIDPEDPIAFAIFPDGTNIEVQTDTQITSYDSHDTNIEVQADPQIASYNSHGVRILTAVNNDSDYPQKGWQLQELLKNALPHANVSVGTNSNVNITVKWGDTVLFDKDGKKETTNDQLTLTGEFGIKDLKHVGGIEWHPSFVPWDIQLLPQQMISKTSYTNFAEIKLSGKFEKSLEDLVKEANRYISRNKKEFKNETSLWGMKITGPSTFNDKVVLGVFGVNLATFHPVVYRSISDAAESSTLKPSLVIYVYLHLDGSISAEFTLTAGYEHQTTKGFNVQKNGYTGSYGSQAQNRSDKHYTIGSNYSADIYDNSSGNLKLNVTGKGELSADGGFGAGFGLLLGGFVPATVDGTVFGRVSGSVEGTANLLPSPSLEGSAALYGGIGLKASIAVKAFVETKIGNTGFDFQKKWEKMLQENTFSTSTWDGTVYAADADGDNTNNDTIPGALITIKNKSTDKTFTTTSNQYGKYKFVSIPKGNYTISASRTGFDSLNNMSVEYQSVKTTLDLFLNPISQQPYFDCSLSGKIVIADTDTDMSNNPPLSGAKIVVRNNLTGLTKESSTKADGTYVLDKLIPGNYTITISKSGYITILEALAINDTTSNVYNATIEAISEEFKGDGTASGTIYDVLTGKSVPGLTLYIRSGINISNGNVSTVLKTDNKGNYKTPLLPAGNYSVQIVDERALDNEDSRYMSSTFSIKILGDHSIPNQDGFVSNGLRFDQLRIVLKWGATPRDLDSHLVGPGANDDRFHTWFGNYNYKVNSKMYANLDLDDTTSYGPETTTIYEMSPGVYTYLVHDYTNRNSSESTALGNSGAYIEVYLGNSSVAAYTFYVPNQPGTLWTVFSFDSTTGKIIPLNKMSYHSIASTVGGNIPVGNSSDSTTSTFSITQIDEPLKEYEK